MWARAPARAAEQSSASFHQTIFNLALLAPATFQRPPQLLHPAPQLARIYRGKTKKQPLPGQAAGGIAIQRYDFNLAPARLFGSTIRRDAWRQPSYSLQSGFDIRNFQ